MKNMLSVLVAVASAVIPFAVRAQTLTPKYWYRFNNTFESKGSSALSWNLDGAYTFAAARNGTYAWNINASGASGKSVFAPANSSFTIFLSVDPGTAGYRSVFSLGSNGDAVNLGIVSLFGGRLGVTRWGDGNSSNGKRQYGILAADGEPGKLHPYALVYDSQAGKLTLYSNGIKAGSTAFEGFGGGEGESTPFQFGSVYGEAVRPFGPANGQANGAVLEDFRFFDIALTDEQVRSLCRECPSQWNNPGDVEALGRIPAYWYTFDGTVRSRGADDLIADEYSFSAQQKTPTPTSFEAMTAERKAGVKPGASGNWFNYGKVDGNASFTACYTGTLGAKDKGVLFAIGSGSSNSNIALCRKNDSSVMVVRWNADSSTYEEIVSASVVKPGDYSHPYCIRYLAESKKLELYVDGLKWGEGDFDGLAGSCPWQIGGIYGGAYHGLAEPDNPKWEDFRFYREAVSEEEIAAIARILPCSWNKWVPYDIALQPTYWYTFDSECLSRGTEYLKSGYSWEWHGFLAGKSYAFARKGSKAAGGLLTENGKGPNGYGFKQTAGGKFTLFFSARIKPVVNGVLLSIGAKDSSANIGFASSEDGLTVRTWNGGAVKNILTVPLEDHGENFHAYATVWDGDKLTLYLDGVAKASTAEFNPDFADANWQFNGTHGGGFGGDKTGEWLLEDFRFYQHALSDGQISVISKRYPVWPDGATHVWNGGSYGVWDMTTANWLRWNVDDWTEETAKFTSDGIALFDVPMSSLDAEAGVSAAGVRFACDAALAFGDSTAVKCARVVVDKGVEVLPLGVEGLIRPGRRLFSGVTAADVSCESDGWGNAYYLSGGSLFYGKDRKGLVLLLAGTLDAWMKTVK